MPKVSIIVPVYNSAKKLDRLLPSLVVQSVKDVEVLIIDDGSSDDLDSVLKKYKVKLIRHEMNEGPAAARNTGIKHASGDVLAFIDSDCVAEPLWAEQMLKHVERADFLMGKVSIPKSTYMGDCISALGFPAGANAGFENVWKVSPEGYTNHISSCNFAGKKSSFKRFGFFDESFPYAGAEDSEFSYRVTKNGGTILFLPSAKVWHEPRKSFRSFVRWQLYRGESNYHFHRTVKSIDSFIRLRAWYAKNIIRDNLFTKRVFLVPFLLLTSFVVQQVGYLKARLNE